jgi:hypothetical protein
MLETFKDRKFKRIGAMGTAIKQAPPEAKDRLNLK